MYRLIYQDGDTTQTHTFSSGEVVIGRSPECQVVLKDFGISRQHAKIWIGEDGDRILLGKFQLTFSKTLDTKVVLDDAKPLSEEAGTIIRSVGELSRLLSSGETAGSAAPVTDVKKAPADVQEIE